MSVSRDFIESLEADEPTISQWYEVSGYPPGFPLDSWVLSFKDPEDDDAVTYGIIISLKNVVRIEQDGSRVVSFVMYGQVSDLDNNIVLFQGSMTESYKHEIGDIVIYITHVPITDWLLDGELKFRMFIGVI